MASTSKIELVYFDGRGKAEPIRFLLCLGKLEYEERNLKTREEMVKLMEDGDLLFNQLPLVRIDGMNLIQSGSIMRYIAEQGGLYGKDSKDRVRIDMVAEGAADFALTFLKFGFLPAEEVQAEIKNKILPKYLPLFQKILEGSKSGYTVGQSLTYADASLFHALLFLPEYVGDSALESYPAVKKFYDLMSNLPDVQKYVKNIRKRKNNDAYIDLVRTVLDWK